MRINFFAGSGAGKSRTAARIYADLGDLGYDVELVREWVKTWAYENRIIDGLDQIKIFGEQVFAEETILKYTKKHIITDSPLLLQIVYAKMYNVLGWENLLEVALKIDEKYPSINIVLDRTGIPYKQDGRYQTESEAKEIDKYVELLLKYTHRQYIVIKTIDRPAILQHIVDKLSKEYSLSDLICTPPKIITQLGNIQ